MKNYLIRKKSLNFLIFLLVAVCVFPGLTKAAETNVATTTLKREPVMLMVHNTLYGSLSRELANYEKNVERYFPVNLHIIRGHWKTPLDIRQKIKQMQTVHKITGVVLVGSLPMHRFFMHGRDNPNPLYYEDVNLMFVDRNNDGVSDGYLGKPNPTLWVANLRSHIDSQKEDVKGLKEFFNKTNTYYHGRTKIEPRSLIIGGSEWLGGAALFRSNFAEKLFGSNNIDVLNGKEITLPNVRNALANHNYALSYIQVHSDWTRQDLEDGNSLRAKEIAAVTRGSLIMVNHGCSTANWMASEVDWLKNNRSDDSKFNTAMSWVFNRGIGQAVVAGVRTGMVYKQEYMYDALIAGDYLGKAYLKTKRAAEEEMSKGDNIPGDIFAGVLLIGNPFLYMKPCLGNSFLSPAGGCSGSPYLAVQLR